MNHEDKAFWDMISEEWTSEERENLLFQAMTEQLFVEIEQGSK